MSQEASMSPKEIDMYNTVKEILRVFKLDVDFTPSQSKDYWKIIFSNDSCYKAYTESEGRRLNKKLGSLVPGCMFLHQTEPFSPKYYLEKGKTFFKKRITIKTFDMRSKLGPDVQQRNVLLLYFVGALKEVWTGYACARNVYGMRMWTPHVWGVDHNNCIVETEIPNVSVYYGVKVPVFDESRLGFSVPTYQLKLRNPLQYDEVEEYDEELLNRRDDMMAFLQSRLNRF